MYLLITTLKKFSIHRILKVRLLKSFDHEDFHKQRQSSGIVLHLPVVMTYLHPFICLLSYNEAERGT